MNKLLFILNLIIYSLVSSFVYGNDKYSFQLKVISDDNLIINEVEESIFKNLKNFKNLEINDQKDFRDGEPLIVLYVYGKKHENSNVDKNIYTFSIAHTSNTEFMNLMSEVFGDKTFNDSSDRMKEITSDLLINKKAILKYLNVASIDNIEKIDILTESVLNGLSSRIGNYYIE